jgi:haloacetate dehalogenase
MALDLLALMRSLGHEQFAVAGHDRGSYVALRLALDHPDAVGMLAVIDGLPISEHLRRADARFARWWGHWWFFAQPDLPEAVINADPDAWYSGEASRMGLDNYLEFRESTRRPDVVRGMLEDYRAGLTVDRQDEEADRETGRQVACPTLVLWSLDDDMEDLYGDPRRIWRDWAGDVSGGGIRAGHHVAEEAPLELANSLASFFALPWHEPTYAIDDQPAIRVVDGKVDVISEGMWEQFRGGMSVVLRPLVDDDEEPLFEMMRDPESVRMAAFTAADPSDRAAFARYFMRIRSDLSNRTVAVEVDGRLAGWAAAFTSEGDREVTYWIDRPLWGRGIAGRALALLLDEERIRPLHAQVAAANAASRAVLRRAGFVEIGRSTGYANGVGSEVECLQLILE